MTPSSPVRHNKVAALDDGLRLDRWFRKHFPALTHGRLEKLLRQGRVRLDGKRAKAGVRIAQGQCIRIPPEITSADTPPSAPQASPELGQDLVARILHQDAHILVLNKPSGLAVQGGRKTHRHIDAALPYLQMDAAEPPRLVHRLDRDTSGALVLARTRQAAQFLTRLFATRKIEKIYWALVHGVPRPPSGVIGAPLAKRAHARGGEIMQIVPQDDPQALSARTDFTTLARAAPRFAWLAFKPHTGRTHQIRAHAAAIGHPIMGDGKYRLQNQEAEGTTLKGLHLHARSIMMPHPEGGVFTCHAPLTGHMADTWRMLKFDMDRTDNPFSGDG